MDEKKVSKSCSLVSEEEKSESLCPMYLSVYYALFALRLLSIPDLKEEKLSEIREKILQESAQLLGLIVWRVQRGINRENSVLLHKLETAKREIEELKRLRCEDAKANEKVVGIFATQEQSWLYEKKKLQQQIEFIMNELRVVEKKKYEVRSKLNEKVSKMELLAESKDKELKDLTKKLSEVKNIADVLREGAKEHSSELWKHKTAFMELVSNQRQLKAEMARVIGRYEATKLDLELILDQKEEAFLLVQKLSDDLLKLHKDTEQKDKILSAMLRKSKLDTAEKQMLLNQIKVTKENKERVEFEKTVISESRHERQSLTRLLTNKRNSKLDSISNIQEAHSNEFGLYPIGNTRSNFSDLVVDYDHPDLIKELDNFSPLANRYIPEENEELGRMSDIKRLDSLVSSEAEKYVSLLQQRQYLEIEAFAEQMSLKDEKLEVFHWRLLSNELESKRLESNIEGLDKETLQLRHENMKLKALLLKKEGESAIDKEGCALQLKIFLDAQKPNYNNSTRDDLDIPETTSLGMSREEDIENEEILSITHQEDINSLVKPPENAFEERDITNVSSIMSPEGGDYDKKLALAKEHSSKPNNSPSRMDLHALGVAYKIKRLKQQLQMLEKLISNQQSDQGSEKNNIRKVGPVNFISLLCLLNKQVSRYESLQGKTDDLCQRKHENTFDVNHRDSKITRGKGKTKALENYLEETFQLQRYIVSTGQKLIEIQSKIGPAFTKVNEELDKSTGFDVKNFADSVGTLFQQVQRGIEVRIARIIGDLGGALACESIIRLNR